MKKLSLTLIISLGLIATFFTACEEDEPGVDTTPTIASLTPTSGPVGSPVTIAGTNFGTTPSVSFGSTAATTSSVSPTSITVEVPASLGLGAVDVTVTAGGETSNAASFEVTEEALPTLVEIAQNTAELSSLVDALTEAGLVDAVSATGPFTVFAPDDDAFADLLSTLSVSGVSDIPDDILQITLLDHVITGQFLSTELNDGDTITALSGRELIVSIDGSTVMVGGATVASADVEASNGVAHIVDAVLMPINPATELALHLIENNNAVADLGIDGSNLTSSEAVVTSDLAAYPAGDFFTEVSYKGAFDPSASSTWLDGWSLLSRGGYLGGTASNQYAFDPADTTGAGSVLVDLPQTIVGNRTLDADSIYRFDGYTFVENGELLIEAGTVLIARTEPTTGDPISGLIITRSATINAQGTADAPIIFTSEDDTEEGGLTELSTGEWGGLIILGEGIVNEDGASELQIEGIPSAIPALYGGANNADNSGILRYVSIRYTGDAIAAGNELQGLTLGAVGSGTTIEFVESFASSDDGVEIFGGAAELKYFAVGFAEDDSYDFDLGYEGNIQFGFAIQNTDQTASDTFIEWDGAVDDNNPIYSDPSLYNMTFIGNARSDQAVLMRDNTAGVLANSIIVDEGGKGIQVENLANTEGDSYNRLVNGEIEILSNVFDLGDEISRLTTGSSGVILPTE